MWVHLAESNWCATPQRPDGNAARPQHALADTPSSGPGHWLWFCRGHQLRLKLKVTGLGAADASVFPDEGQRHCRISLLSASITQENSINNFNTKNKYSDEEKKCLPADHCAQFEENHSLVPKSLLKAAEQLLLGWNISAHCCLSTRVRFLFLTDTVHTQIFTLLMIESKC